METPGPDGPGVLFSWLGAVAPWDGLAGSPWAGRCSTVLAQAGLPEVPVERVWSEAREQGAGVVLLDERCPGVSAEVVRRVLTAASTSLAVGVRPVTDTVKALRDGYVGPTVDRDALVAVCAPLVVPPGVVGRIRPSTDLAGLVAAASDVVTVEVPSVARRLADATELVLLGSAASGE